MLDNATFSMNRFNIEQAPLNSEYVAIFTENDFIFGKKRLKTPIQHILTMNVEPSLFWHSIQTCNDIFFLQNMK